MTHRIARIGGAAPTRRAVLGLALAAPALHNARAVEFPDRPLRMVVPFSPGGSVDIIGRMVANRLSVTLGQPVVVENRGGASGGIGSQAVARAAPDGYTLLVGSTSTISILPQAEANAGYDPAKDFVPLSLACYVPHVIAVNPALPVRSVPDLVALARTRPINCGSGGPGTPHYLAAEILARKTGMQLTHIPYRGGGETMNDLVAGTIDMYSVELSAVAPVIREGRVRALGVSARDRAATFPDIPTVMSQGVPDYEITSWYGFLGVAGTPAPIAARLAAEIAVAMRDPGVRARLEAASTTIVGSTAAEFAAHIAREHGKWGAALRQARS